MLCRPVTRFALSQVDS